MLLACLPWLMSLFRPIQGGLESLAIAWASCLAKHWARRFCWANHFLFINHKPWSLRGHFAAAATIVTSKRPDSSWPLCDATSVTAVSQ